jgi:hypothetical protein
MAEKVQFRRVRGRIVPIRASERAKAGIQAGAQIGALVGSVIPVAVPSGKMSANTLKTFAKGAFRNTAMGAAVGALSLGAAMAAFGPKKSYASNQNIEKGEAKVPLVAPISTAFAGVGVGMLATKISSSPKAAAFYASGRAGGARLFRQARIRLKGRHLKSVK